MDRSGRDIFKILSWNLSQVTEEYHDKPRRRLSPGRYLKLEPSKHKQECPYFTLF